MLIRLFKTSTLEKSDKDIRAGQLACYRKPYSPTSNNNEVEITFQRTKIILFSISIKFYILDAF